MKIKINCLMLVLLVCAGMYAKPEESVPRLNIWVHGTTIRAAVPVKLAQFHNSNKLMHYSELMLDRGACPRAKVLAQADSVEFALNDFYLFRWSGLLNWREREAASIDLYHALNSKIDEIVAKTGKYPIITLLTHSHGGNVALSLAKINKKFDNKLKIARLVLLACPVQHATAHLANDEMFGKVYAFYSNYDFIQVMAFQRLGKPALRKFSKFSNKVIHVKTGWGLRGLWHNEFKDLPFLGKLVGALKQIDHAVSQKAYSLNCDYNLIV